ncbi:hypothetical protein P4U90_19495 [Cytobacillus kochii]|uniref:hypothetical protein n=1 Tax=Cytobacillus kochii TaxID=859143 RepID=UPI002E20418A|nr:hypothetical protein [Cytobacillus kochii]
MWTQDHLHLLWGEASIPIRQEKGLGNIQQGYFLPSRRKSRLKNELTKIENKANKLRKKDYLDMYAEEIISREELVEYRSIKKSYKSAKVRTMRVI